MEIDKFISKDKGLNGLRKRHAQTVKRKTRPAGRPKPGGGRRP